VVTGPSTSDYPVQLEIDYPDRELNRATSFFRILAAIPIFIVLEAVSGGSSSYRSHGAHYVMYGAGGMLFAGPLLMIVFRQKYPRWWFDWNLELQRFETRVIKWFLAIPHYIVLFFLLIGSIFAVIAAWFAILFTGRYPRGLFDFVLGVMRWGQRVGAYAFLLVTDAYPPFRLAP
jgi:hypothetical protein